MKKILTIASSIAFCVTMQAQINIDNTFGTNGIVKTDFNNHDDELTETAMQTDGKIIAVGFANNGTDNDFAISRYNTNGTLDNSFGANGKVTQNINGNDEINSVALQSDGKLIVAGFSTNSAGFQQFTVARYNTNGTLDNTFGNSGLFTKHIGGFDNYLQSVAIESDGKIICGGSYNDANSNGQMVVMRLNTNGSLDNTFNSNGYTAIDIDAQGEDVVHKLLIQADNKIVVAGNSINNNGQLVILRLTTNGTKDATFGNAGVLVIPITGYDARLYDAIFEASGKILICGEATNTNTLQINGMVARITTSGAIDNSFGNASTGITFINSSTLDVSGSALKLQQDGKIVMSGYVISGPDNYDFAMHRLSANGVLDNSFGTNGTIIINSISADYDLPSDIQIQKDGKIIIAGLSNFKPPVLTNYNAEEFCLVRYNTDTPTSILNTNNNINFEFSPNPVSNYIVVDALAYALKYNILNANGAVITTSLSNKINIETFAPGVYYLQINTKEGSAIKQFIKQ